MRPRHSAKKATCCACTHIVHPICQEHSPGIHPLVERSTATTDFLGHHFCGVHGHYNALAAHADTSDDPTSIPPCQRPCGRYLDGNANAENGSGRDDSPFSTKSVRDRVGGKSRNERAKLFQAHCERADFRGSASVEVADEGLESQDAASNASVITSQERGDTACGELSGQVLDYSVPVFHKLTR